MSLMGGVTGGVGVGGGDGATRSIFAGADISIGAAADNVSTGADFSVFTPNGSSSSSSSTEWCRRFNSVRRVRQCFFSGRRNRNDWR